MSQQKQRLPYYAMLGVRQDDRVRRIRDYLWWMLEPPEGYEKVEPHITLHPGFTCDRRTASKVSGVMAFVIGLEIDVTGVSFWPDAEEPMVVKLDLDTDLDSYRRTIEHHVERNDGIIDREPVPAHITLFKSGDADEAPASLMGDVDRLKSLDGKHGGWTVEVGGYRVKRRG